MNAFEHFQRTKYITIQKRKQQIDTVAKLEKQKQNRREVQGDDDEEL